MSEESGSNRAAATYPSRRIGHSACASPTSKGRVAGATSGSARKRLQRLELALRCDVKASPRPGERSLGESRRRIEQELAAGARQRADRGVAVDLGEQRRRAAGRVIAGTIFALEQHDAARLGEMGGDRGAGDAGADDDDVSVIHLSDLAERASSA